MKNPVLPEDLHSFELSFDAAEESDYDTTKLDFFVYEGYESTEGEK